MSEIHVTVFFVPTFDKHICMFVLQYPYMSTSSLYVGLSSSFFFFWQIEKQIKESTKLLGNSKLKNNEEKLKEQFKG